MVTDENEEEKGFESRRNIYILVEGGGVEDVKVENIVSSLCLGRTVREITKGSL